MQLLTIINKSAFTSKMILPIALGMAICAAMFIGYFYGLSGEDVRAAVMPHVLFLGDTAAFEIIFRGGADAEVILPDMREALKGFAILKEGRSESCFLWRKRTKAWWSFAVENMGENTIPTARISYLDSGRNRRELSTMPITFTVKGIAKLEDVNVYTARIGGEMVSSGRAAETGGQFRSVDGQIRLKIKDEKSPLGIIDYGKVFIFAGACAFGLLISCITFMVLSRRPPKKRYIPPDKVLSTHLGMIENDMRSGAKSIKESYYELSFSLREYIKTMLKMPAQEPTTKELIEMMDKSSVMETGTRDVLKELLSACDEVKYSAGVSPKAAGLEHHLKIARKIAVCHLEDLERSERDEGSGVRDPSVGLRPPSG